MRKPRVKDLTGLRFGRLVVKEQAGFHVKPSGKRVAKWLCVCDCGESPITQGSILQMGHCNSCGCISKKVKTKEAEELAELLLKTPKLKKNREISKKVPRFTYLHNLQIFEKSDKQIYHVWNAIQNRVGITTAYLDCTTTDNFKDSEFFLIWYRTQYGSNLNWEIDKDLLVKGNRCYGEKTCVLLPKEINMALSCQKSSRGNLPRGVSFEKAKNNYLARCSMGRNGQINLGRFNTSKEAFLAYKTFKELLLKSLAFKYKRWLDPRAYQTLMCYEITIDS